VRPNAHIYLVSKVYKPIGYQKAYMYHLRNPRMQLVFEKEVTITKLGGSVYVRLEEPFFATLGVEKPAPDVNGTINGHDARIAVGIGKHGKFVFLYSPKLQAKERKEAEKQGE
jgi:hypothetical protein